MTSRIGPSFMSEMAAAGARTDGLSLSVSDGACVFADTVAGGAWTPQQKAAVAAVVAAHDPTRIPFALKMAPTERAAGRVERGLEDLLVWALGQGFQPAPALKAWVNQRRALRGETQL